MLRVDSGAKMRFGPFLLIALLLIILWLGGFLMFHVASGLIHLLLLFAVISFVAHLFTGARTA
jgi:Family of unknown function (DUF5670)